MTMHTTPACFSTKVTSSGSYNNEDVQVMLPIKALNC